MGWVPFSPSWVKLQKVAEIKYLHMTLLKMNMHHYGSLFVIFHYWNVISNVWRLQ